MKIDENATMRKLTAQVGGLTILECQLFKTLIKKGHAYITSRKDPSAKKLVAEKLADWGVGTRLNLSPKGRAFMVKVAEKPKTKRTPSTAKVIEPTQQVEVIEDDLGDYGIVEESDVEPAW